VRTYSDSERFSAFASLDNASSSDGETRSLISTVHFSCMADPQKKPPPPMLAGRANPPAGGDMGSGGLLSVVLRKNIRSSQANEHKARWWYAVLTPLRDGAFRDFA